MIGVISSQIEKDPQNLRKFWPLFFAQALLSLSLSGLMLNMLKMSYIIWEDGTFHPIEMGLLISVKIWAMAISGLAIGHFADKFSRKRLFSLIFFIMGISRLVNGFSPTGSSTAYIFFTISYFFTGIGQGGMKPIVQSFTNDSIKPKERSRMFGKLEAVTQISQIGGMVLSALLFQLDLWREFFWISGILLFFCSGLIMSYLPEPKRGVMHDSLRDVLGNSEVKYDYKLNAETVKSTIFSNTNIIAFIEGVFTWIVFAIAIYMLYPYIQGPPYNISPIMTSIIMILFGLPGSVFGALVFTKLSDRLARRDIKWRINLIVFSIISLYILILAVFIIPLPRLSATEGNSIGYLLSLPQVWALGFTVFGIRAVLGIYHINQSPLLQEINLPEAQGTISAWNQFLENVGFGIGPVLAGYILTINGGNYFNAASIALLIGMPTILLWFLARFWVHKDVANIVSILEQRSKELENSHSITSATV